MNINSGIKNENKIIEMFNNKRKKDLSRNASYLADIMFDNIDSKSKFTCTRIMGYIKPDIEIKYKSQTHYISIKTGAAETVHEEELKKFIIWLRQFNISVKTQKTLLLFQYGDGTMDGTGTRRMPHEEIFLRLRDQIKEANKELNSNEELVKAVINRCVFQGSNEEYQSADYIYFGDTEFGILVSKTQVFKYLHTKKQNWNYIRNIHIGPLHLTPHARYVNKLIKVERYRHVTNFVWKNLQADLRYISNRYDG